jgi:mannose-6-phosphate isomerase-like protein (cupin superfamily)
MENEIDKLMQSGQLELYAMGALTPEENLEVESMMNSHAVIRAEVEAIQNALETVSESFAVSPPVTVKPLVFALIEHHQRLTEGKLIAADPPALNAKTIPADFDLWVNAPENKIPSNFDEFYAIMIGEQPEMSTAIAWIKSGAPVETHEQHIEKFFILEGTCEIVVEGVVHQLSTGDYFEIPLFSSHYLRVTSSTPCKVILQRIAA